MCISVLFKSILAVQHDESTQCYIYMKIGAQCGIQLSTFSLSIYINIIYVQSQRYKSRLSNSHADILGSKREIYSGLKVHSNLSLSGISSYICSLSFPSSSSLAHVVIASFFSMMVSQLFWDCGTLVSHEELVIFTSALEGH